MARRSRNKKQTPLIVEPHPEDYNGYPFITLIQYKKQHVLTIIDNVDDKSIKAFVLDLCTAESIQEELVVSIAAEWYSNNRGRFPVSFEFSRRGLTGELSRLLRTFNIDYVTRVIGPLPRFEMNKVKNVKRRKRKPVPEGVQVNRKANLLD